MDITIVGAGLSGLIAGCMLKHHSITIQELQPKIPNNHSALLRFKTSKVGDALNIPFRQVTVLKDIMKDLEPLSQYNRASAAIYYSIKTTGEARSDRSIIACPEVVHRYIAPSNFISRMSGRLMAELQLGVASNFKANTPIISTMPMPTLMNVLDHPRKDKCVFRSHRGGTINTTLENCDAYITFYDIGDNDILRMSITGNELIVEVKDDSLGEQHEVIDETVSDIARQLGLGFDRKTIIFKKQKYAKILPIDETERKRFLFWATDKHGIYSLGRYATWRPKLLLDDIVQDVRLIENWIESSDGCSVAAHRDRIAVAGRQT